MKGHWGKLLGYFFGTLVLVTVGIALPAIFGGSWLPELISDEGTGIDALFWGMVVLSIVILAIVMTLVLYSVVHFRAAEGDESDGAHIHGNPRVELVWTIIPAIIVVAIGLLSYQVLISNEEAPPEDQPQMTVFVRGFSFGWKFAYDDEYLTTKQLEKLELSGRSPALDQPESGDMVVPLGTTVRFEVISCSGKEAETEQVVHGEDGEVEELLSNQCVRRYGEPTGTRVTGKYAVEGNEQDVNHAFWVPEARLKIDAVAGIPTWTQWTPDEITGVDDHPQVVCAELCGSGHNAMRVDACVVEPETFEWWQDELTDEEFIPCANLKLFTCVKDEDDFDAMNTAATAAIAKDADAGCGEFTKELEASA